MCESALRWRRRHWIGAIRLHRRALLARANQPARARAVHTAERIISLRQRRHYHIQHAKITKRTSGGVPRTIIFQQQTSKSKRPHRVMTTAVRLHSIYHTLSLHHGIIQFSRAAAIEKDTNGIFNVIINMRFGWLNRGSAQNGQRSAEFSSPPRNEIHRKKRRQDEEAAQKWKSKHFSLARKVELYIIYIYISRRKNTYKEIDGERSKTLSHTQRAHCNLFPRFEFKISDAAAARSLACVLVFFYQDKKMFTQEWA